MGLKSSQLNFLPEDATNLPKLQRDYIYFIQKNMRDIFLTIQHSPDNNRIATEKKNFERTLPVRLSLHANTKGNKKINWKDYLISYLKKQEQKGIGWFSDIRLNIENETFFKENYYLSDMFFKNYEMQMKPSCLRDININSSNDNDKNEPLDLFEAIERKFNSGPVSRRNSSIDNKLDLTHVTENLGGSFIDSDEVVIEEGVYDKSARDKVKDYVKIFKAHLLQTDHPINKVIQIFEAKVSSVITNKITVLKAMKSSKDKEFTSMLNDVCDGFVDVIQKFIIKTQSAFKLMYSDTINLQCFFEEKDEVINLVCSILFSTGVIYEKIYELFTMQLKKTLNTFEQKITQLVDVTPKEIQIHVKYRLDESTALYKQEIYETESKKKMSKHNITTTISIPSQSSEHSINFDGEIKQMNTKVGLSSSSSSLPSLSLKEEKEKILKSEASYSTAQINTNASSHTKRSKVKVYDDFHNTNPINGYNTAITIMKSIKYNKVPFEKMMLLASVSTEITDCITSFWSGMDQYLPPSLLSLNADDLMHIFIFIIIKTQMPELLVQERIIEKFTTNRSRSTTMGYYTTVLEGSLEYIERETIMGIGRITTIKKNKDKEKEMKSKQEDEIIDDEHITIMPFSIETSKMIKS